MKLIRYESTSDGTYGILTFGGAIFHTVERPWLNNKPFESCIPPGEYKLTPFTRSNGDHVLALTGDTVSIEKSKKERYAVLIHPANYMHEVVGCIGPGMDRVGNMVTHSRDAVSKILALYATKPEQTLFIQFGEYHA